MQRLPSDQHELTLQGSVGESVSNNFDKYSVHETSESVEYILRLRNNTLLSAVNG